MAKIPVTNPGNTFKHVGPVTIPPGGTRMVDETYVGRAPAAAAVTENTVPFDGLLDNKIPDIVAALAGLSAADLTTLKTAEEAGKSRKGVLEAIDAQLLTLASIGQGDDPTSPDLNLFNGLLDGTVEEITEALPGYSTEELQQLRDAEAAGNTREGVIKAIDAQLEQLADSNPDGSDQT